MIEPREQAEDDLDGTRIGERIAAFAAHIHIGMRAADVGDEPRHEVSFAQQDPDFPMPILVEMCAHIFERLADERLVLVLGIRAFERFRAPRPIESSITAIVTMAGSIVATTVITAYLKRNAVQSESSALAGDALHYTSDVISNGATIVALIVVRYTGNPIYDSILGVSVACWIGWNSLYLIWNAGNDLMDPALPEHEIGAIIEAIERADPNVVAYRDLRTRRSAGVRFIEFELCIERSVSFDRAHDITEAVKAMIRAAFPRVVITVHAEPVDQNSRAPATRAS